MLRVQLDALAGQVAAPPFEVVLADNGSTDNTREIGLSYTDRLDLRVVDASQRVGVAHARNTGARAARGEFVVFCDADDMVSNRWVAEMTRSLQESDLVGGPLEFTTLSEPGAAHLRYQPPWDDLPVSMHYLPYANGGNLGIRRGVLEELGGFDTTFVRGHEEVDLAWRAQHSGFRIGFSPRAVAHIRHRGTLKGTLSQTFHYGRTHSQLFSRHKAAPIPRTPWRREARTYAILLRQGARAALHREPMGGWLTTMAWTVGRLYGDVKYRVRAPL